MSKLYNRQLIKDIHSVMASMNKESFSFDVKDENCPCVTNQNNNFKYKIDTIYIPNIGREKYFIELDAIILMIISIIASSLMKMNGMARFLKVFLIKL